MKLGISIKIDVTKIDKSRIFIANSGAKYIDLTTFIDTEEQDQYGNNGFISQSVSKEEREQGTKTPILGNSKVFYTSQEQSQGYQQQQPQSVNQQPIPDDDIPF